MHAGIVMLFAAFAGLAFKTEHDVTLKTGEAYERTDPYGHQWRFVSQGVSTSNRPDRDRHGGWPRDVPRRKARRHHLEREAPVSSTRSGNRSSSRSPKSASTPRRSWTRTSCSPACAVATRPSSCDVQSARRVGVDRRLRDDDRRPDRHVAAGRASARAGGIRRGDAVPQRDAAELPVARMTSRREFLTRARGRIGGARAAAACATRRTRSSAAPMHDSSIVPRHDQSVRDGSERGARGSLPPQAGRDAVLTTDAARRARAPASTVSADARSTSSPAARRTFPARCRRRCTATSWRSSQGGYGAQEIIDAFVGDVWRARADGAEEIGLQSARVVRAGRRRPRRRRGASLCCCAGAMRETARGGRGARVRRRRRRRDAGRAGATRRGGSRRRRRRDRCARHRNAARGRRAGVRALSGVLRVSPRRRVVGAGRAAARRERRAAVAALREIEFDRATGKLSDADYAELKARYTQRSDRRDASRSRCRRGGRQSRVATDDEIEAAVRAYRAEHMPCPTCGPRPEPDAVFCSNCGRYLHDRCAGCGAPVVALDARYCMNCGNRLAA